MKVKDMRVFLMDKVDVVPRKNEDVIAMYNEKCSDDAPIVADIENAPVLIGDKYTYVGQGDAPPHMINYMGKQVFVRGQPVIVTDSEVLAKIGINKSFVKGKADMDEAYKSDELAAKRAKKQIEEDVKLQIMIERANRKA